MHVKMMMPVIILFYGSVVRTKNPLSIAAQGDGRGSGYAGLGNGGLFASIHAPQWLVVRALWRLQPRLALGPRQGFGC